MSMIGGAAKEEAPAASASSREWKHSTSKISLRRRPQRGARRSADDRRHVASHAAPAPARRAGETAPVQQSFVRVFRAKGARLSLLEKTFQDHFAAGLVEIHRELRTVHIRDRAGTELHVKDARPRAEPRRR